MSASRGRARFGVLVPFTNTNLEPDAMLLRPDGVSLHFARLGGYDQDEIPDADQPRVEALMQQCGAWEPLWQLKSLPIEPGQDSELPFRADTKMVGVNE